MADKGIGTATCEKHGDYNIDEIDSPCPSCEDGLTVDDLHVGAEVYWNDPDNDECSGYYKVHHISTDEIIILTPLDDSGGITEVFISELS